MLMTSRICGCSDYATHTSASEKWFVMGSESRSCRCPTLFPPTWDIFLLLTNLSLVQYQKCSMKIIFKIMQFMFGNNLTETFTLCFFSFYKLFLFYRSPVFQTSLLIIKADFTTCQNENFILVYPLLKIIKHLILWLLKLDVISILWASLINQTNWNLWLLPLLVCYYPSLFLPWWFTETGSPVKRLTISFSSISPQIILLHAYTKVIIHEQELMMWSLNIFSNHMGNFFIYFI